MTLKEGHLHTRSNFLNLDPVNYEELDLKCGLNVPELTEVNSQRLTSEPIKNQQTNPSV